MKQLAVWSLLATFAVALSPLNSIAAPDASSRQSAKPAPAASTAASTATGTKPATAANATAAEKAANAQGLDRAIFGLGCFWKSQHVFSKVPGVVRTRVGYSGGKPANPNYEQVCSHTTGHAEVVEVEYDPKKVTYGKLLQVFFSSHDPTTLNRQGFDMGDQYRSAIFYTSPQQKDEALKYKQTLEKEHKFGSAIVTEITPAAKFYSAETYHQDYYKKHGAACF